MIKRCNDLAKDTDSAIGKSHAQEIVKKLEEIKKQKKDTFLILQKGLNCMSFAVAFFAHLVSGDNISLWDVQLKLSLIFWPVDLMLTRDSKAKKMVQTVS